MTSRTLFNCVDAPGGSLDNVAANDSPGIFGYVRAFFGVVEPQMRKALHTHMLVYLLAFARCFSPLVVFCGKRLLPQFGSFCVILARAFGYGDVARIAALATLGKTEGYAGSFSDV